MKTVVMACLLWMCAFLIRGEQRDSQRYVIGISPFLQAGEKDEVFRSIVRFVLEDAELGSAVQLYDAFHLKTIVGWEIPDSSVYRSSKTRATQFREQIVKLRTFLAAAPQLPEVPHLNFERAVRLPQFMEFVGNHLVFTGAQTVVLVLGSPLYMDLKEPAFSMAEGAFPSDGHLLASKEKTVYGRPTRGEPLRDVRVHLCWFGDPWISEAHREKVSRFWRLYLAEQGAELATQGGDLPTAFGAVRRHEGSLRKRRMAMDGTRGKVEMLHISRKVEQADWITSDEVAEATIPPGSPTGPMKIGIRWKGNIDLDLYAAPSTGGECLFFEHPRSSDGYYFKDHRSSPEREYEYIEFERPVDAWKVEASVNFFEGTVAEAPRGEVRIEFGGRIYTGQLTMAARRGNQGRAGPDQRAYWFEIDVPGILKLKEGAASGGG